MEAHRELAAALEDARDVTGDVACLLEIDDYDGAAELVHEWRGALFRVRLASPCRPIRLPPPLPRELEDPPTTTAAAVALSLLAAGTVAFLAGAVLVIWPLWAAGLASSRRRYSCTARRRRRVSSRPRSSMLSKRPGETFEPVTARIG